MIHCCVFDLDGTLLSTLDTITHHLNNTLTREGIPPITVEQTRAFIGDGARKLVSRAVMAGGAPDEEKINRVRGIYNDAYNSDPFPLTEPYDGVVNLIDRLHKSGVKLAVVTNKPEVTAKKLIEYFFPGKFDSIVGGRKGAILKPDPADTLNVISSLGEHPTTTAFIGDTSVDINTGKNAGVLVTVGVGWGFREKSELRDAGADIIVDTAEELYCELEKI